MAKTRLLVAHKDLLKKFARENIECPKEDKARAAAYERAAKLVRADIDKKFPPKDMALLDKYQQARHARDISGASPSGQFATFSFDEVETAPLLPRSGYHSNSIPFTAATVKAIEKFELANDAKQEAHQSVLRDYLALIEGSRNFEDLVAIWSGAEALREKIVKPNTALSVLTDEAVSRIQKTNITAQAA